MTRPHTGIQVTVSLWDTVFSKMLILQGAVPEMGQLFFCAAVHLTHVITSHV
jgi:hypothetical protein